MREHNLNKVNVLGVNVCDLRPEKAVALSLEAMRNNEFGTVFFHSAVSSLYCQEKDRAMEFVNTLKLVLPGDRHMEMTVLQEPLTGDNGPGTFVRDYMRRLFARMHREYRELFIVSESDVRIDLLKEYLAGTCPNITAAGMVFERETEGAADKVVNEINAQIPDVLLLLLPVEDQLMFLEGYESMMNAGLCICVESLQSFVTDMAVRIPSWVRLLHLTRLYSWFHNEKKLQKRIAGSVFKKRVNEDILAESENDEQNR